MKADNILELIDGVDIPEDFDLFASNLDQLQSADQVEQAYNIYRWGFYNGMKYQQTKGGNRLAQSDRIAEIRRTVRGIASTLEALTQSKAAQEVCETTLDDTIYFLAQQGAKAADELEEIESRIMKGDVLS